MDKKRSSRNRWAPLTVAVVMFSSFLLAVPSQAADRSVDIYGYYSPATTTAISGDTVTWTARQGGHNVYTYNGNQAFQSAPWINQGDTFSVTFTGGTTFYRCTYHSNIAASGACVGMCGAITDKTTAPALPTITSPSDGSSTADQPVQFSGTGEAYTEVRLFEGTAMLGYALVGSAGTWLMPVYVSKGTHTVTAKAFHVNGLESGSTAPITFTETADIPDQQAPATQMGTKQHSVFPGAVTISGTAADNVAVSEVMVIFYPLDGVVSYSATCTCPASVVDWSLTVRLPAGHYGVFARSKDTNGNWSYNSQGIDIWVLGLPV